MVGGFGGGVLGVEGGGCGRGWVGVRNEEAENELSGRAALGHKIMMPPCSILRVS